MLVQAAAPTCIPDPLRPRVRITMGESGPLRVLGQDSPVLGQELPSHSLGVITEEQTSGLPALMARAT